MLDCSDAEREARAGKARAYAQQFDRSVVFSRLMDGVAPGQQAVL